MIRLSIVLDRRGCLSSFTADGHAGGAAAGQDIVCAAATALLRTAARSVLAVPGIGAEADAPAPGAMRLTVLRCEGRQRPWLRGVTDFLLTGLADLQAEYPQRVEMIVHR